MAHEGKKTKGTNHIIHHEPHRKPKKVPLVKSIVARAKNRTPWTFQACVEACVCDRMPDITRTAHSYQIQNGDDIWPH